MDNRKELNQFREVVGKPTAAASLNTAVIDGNLQTNDDDNAATTTTTTNILGEQKQLVKEKRIDAIISEKWYNYDLLVMSLAALQGLPDNGPSELNRNDLCRTFVDNILDDINVRSLVTKLILNCTRAMIKDCKESGNIDYTEIAQLRAYYLWMFYLLPKDLKPQADSIMKEHCYRGKGRLYENYMALKKATVYFITKSMDTLFSTISFIFIGGQQRKKMN